MARNPNDKWQRLADTAVKARQPFDRDMLLNLAFYLGEQYVEYKEDWATIRKVPRTDRFLNQPRPVANKLMHFANQSHAQALQAKPTVDVLPATDDVVDVTASGVARSYLTWVTEPQVEAFDAKLSDAVMWAIIMGNGYLKWTWDEQHKRPCISVPNTLDIFVDPYVSNFYDARYLVHRRFMDPEQVYDRFGVEVKASDTEVADPTRTELLRSLGITSNLSGALVHELWMRPTKRFPEGIFTVWCGKQVLVSPGKFPYEHKRLPFTQLGVIPRPGSWCYLSALQFLRAPQMELNKYHAQRIRIREGFANPKWFLDSELAQSLNAQPDDSPNQILIGDSQRGTVEPKILQPTGMADNNEGAWINEEMMHIVGLHEVSQAQVPGRVEAAKAIEMLKDADVSRLAELGSTVNRSISEGFWQMLQLAQQYEKSERIVTTYSREGMPEVQKFMATDFKDAMRVRVTYAGGLARSRAARQEQLLLLWQNQVIRDPQLMAELMELPIPTFISATAYDLKLARSENYTLAKSEAVAPNSWDDHDIHIREHNNFRKTQEYLQLTNDAKQKFEFHVQKHKDLRAEVLQEEIQVQMLKMQASGQMPPPAPPGAPQSPAEQDPGQQPVPGTPTPPA